MTSPRTGFGSAERTATKRGAIRFLGVLARWADDENHAQVDVAGSLILLKLIAGQVHDRRSAVVMPGRVGPGQTLLAHRGYDTGDQRAPLAARSATPIRKPMMPV